MELLTVNPPVNFSKLIKYQHIKHLLDLILSLFILPFTLPIMLLCAAAIFLESGWPIIFVQERIGRGGHPFRVYKFRTMRTNFDDRNMRAFMQAFVQGQIDETADRSTYKPPQSSAVTRVGSFLRKSSLDELPQIINILRGEMSWIGPRPNVPFEVQVYSPWHHERLEVLPGITGLAQVRGRSCLKFDSIVNSDIEYIENQSWWLDLKIVAWTLLVVVKNKGAE